MLQRLSGMGDQVNLIVTQPKSFPPSPFSPFPLSPSPRVGLYFTDLVVDRCGCSRNLCCVLKGLAN